MLDPLAWLDELPDKLFSGVPGVLGVPPQKTVGFERNTYPEPRCSGVLGNTLEHRQIVEVFPQKPQKTATEHREHLEHLKTDRWLSDQPGEVGEWAKLLRDRQTMPDPTSISALRWRQVVDDAATFLTTWGGQAVAMGWTAIDLFAVPPGPDRWLARHGLVALLRGRPVAAITKDAITITNPNGGVNRFRRSPIHGAVMLWDATAFSEQPN